VEFAQTPRLALPSMSPSKALMRELSPLPDHKGKFKPPNFSYNNPSENTLDHRPCRPTGVLPGDIKCTLCVCVFSPRKFNFLLLNYILFSAAAEWKKIPVSVSASSLHIIPGALLFYHPQRPDLIELSLLQFPTPNMVYDGPWKLLPSSYIMTTCSD